LAAPLKKRLAKASRFLLRVFMKKEQTMTTDVVIIGAGPAGIFTALEMIKKGSKKKIVLVEKGKSVEERHCPKAITGKCMNCKPYCHITTGFSGAGAFSDGKLSLSHEVGGDLPTLIGEKLAQETIDYTDKIYLEFGADTHVEGVGNGEDQGHPPPGHTGGAEAGGLPHPPHGHGKGPGNIYMSIEHYLHGQRRGGALRLRVPQPYHRGRRLQGRHT
jgi:hypothetical protein